MKELFFFGVMALLFLFIVRQMLRVHPRSMADATPTEEEYCRDVHAEFWTNNHIFHWCPICERFR